MQVWYHKVTENSLAESLYAIENNNYKTPYKCFDMREGRYQNLLHRLHPSTQPKIIFLLNL